MAERITCCPHCGTSFRVTDAHLQIAKGAVRCGSCLQIFRALDHLLENSASNTAIKPETLKQTPTQSPTNTEHSTQAEQPQPELESEPQAELEQKPEPEQEQEQLITSEEADVTTSVADRSDRYDPDRWDDAYADADTGEDDDLELDDDALISDDMNLEDRDQSVHLGDLSDDFKGSSSSSQGSLFDRPMKFKIRDDFDDSDESWAIDLLEEEEADDEWRHKQLESDDPVINDDLTVNKADSDALFDTEKTELPDIDVGEYAAATDSLTDHTLNHEKDDESRHPQANLADNKDSSTTAPSSTAPAPIAPAPLASISTFPDDEQHHNYDLGSTGSFPALSDDDISAIKTSSYEQLGDDDQDAEPLFHLSKSSSKNSQKKSRQQETRSKSRTADFNQQRSLALENDSTPQDEHEPSLTNATKPLLDAIAQAPVEMEWQPPSSPWPKRLMWGVLSLIALAGLGAQYAWYQFDSLSRQQPWRPYYAQACDLLGCQLPSVNAPEKVKAYNLVVRSHPDTPQALVIDSILLNNASFEQPFPDFVLTFSNLQNQQLASRRFTPQEYLAGELAGASVMPVGQPVHISLEIVDPGEDAVNYTAHIPTQ